MPGRQSVVVVSSQHVGFLVDLFGNEFPHHDLLALVDGMATPRQVAELINLYATGHGLSSVELVVTHHGRYDQRAARAALRASYQSVMAALQLLGITDLETRIREYDAAFDAILVYCGDLQSHWPRIVTSCRGLKIDPKRCLHIATPGGFLFHAELLQEMILFALSEYTVRDNLVLVFVPDHCDFYEAGQTVTEQQLGDSKRFVEILAALATERGIEIEARRAIGRRPGQK